jgi:TonB-linked SusC/RagA family outer membrane protein
MARANYTLNDKYVFTATFRADGSSKFQDENRWGYFPSFSAAWILSDENFIKSFESISNLKFRAGWGQVGNQAVSPYQTLSGYSANQYAQAGNGLAIAQFLSNVANPSLKWETTVQTNIGLDFGFLNERFTGSIEYYIKETNDLITLAPIPGSSGFSRIQTNKGTLASNGLEIALNNIIVNNDNFRFEIGGNIAFTKNEIQDTKASLASIYINGQEEMRAFELGNLVGNRGPYNVFIDGEEPGLFYGFQTDGIYQDGDTFIDGAQAGDVNFVDTNGDGVINISDRTIIGNPNPDFVYGLNMNISYKRFNLSANFDGVYGNDIINTQFETLNIAEGSFSNITVNAYEQAWRPGAPSNTYPRIGAFISGKGGPVDRMVSDGSYFRLNNLTLGYDIPVNGFASKAQIYMAATNLFTITDYTGYTPVLTSYLNDPLILGVDNYNPPNSRVVTLGLTINF